MMTLPPVEFEQALWSITAMLQDVEYFPRSGGVPGQRGTSRPYEGGFFCGTESG
jgi:hypothetical protein